MSSNSDPSRPIGTPGLDPGGQFVGPPIERAANANRRRCLACPVPRPPGSNRTPEVILGRSGALQNVVQLIQYRGREQVVEIRSLKGRPQVPVVDDHAWATPAVAGNMVAQLQIEPRGRIDLRVRNGRITLPARTPANWWSQHPPPGRSSASCCKAVPNRWPESQCQIGTSA